MSGEVPPEEKLEVEEKKEDAPCATAQDAILQMLARVNPDAVVYDKLDTALLGIVARAGAKPVALYGRDLCIQAVMKEDKLTEQQADQFMAENVDRLWVGDHTPYILIYPSPKINMEIGEKDSAGP